MLWGRLVPELLIAEGLFAGYGESIVLEGVSFALEQGGSLALLGRNGVGKTTLLLTLMGLTRLKRGRLLMRGRDISHTPTYLRARSGVGWPQRRRQDHAAPYADGSDASQTGTTPHARQGHIPHADLPARAFGVGLGATASARPRCSLR